MGTKQFEIYRALKTAEKLWRAKFEVADIANHGPAKGDILEEAVRELFGTILPSRYRVDRGFVVSMDNKRSEQIDCIVYDNTYTPVLFREYGMPCVPAEAVHAVFEIKQEVDTKSVPYAAKKVESVRALHRTTGSYIVDGEIKGPKPIFPIIGGLFARKIAAKSGWGDDPQVLLNHIEGEPKKRYLDIVLTGENGAAECFESGYPDAQINVHSSDGGLMVGMFMLVRALQAQGTVPAIDIDKYVSRTFLGDK